MASDRRKASASGLLFLSALLLLAVWTVLQTGLWTSEDRLVVYCAHDAVYAEQILRDFEQRTGIRVDVRFDTEATKSLGLVQQILQEQESPRCDVFWNNELLGTLELQEQGLLEPYQGTAWQRLPEKFRDASGHWVGFGARLRVYIVNPDKMATTAEAIEAALAGDLSQMAIARPMFGTTLTQYSVLWRESGAEGLIAWHQSLHRQGVKVVAGNAMVKNLVAAGTCEFGLTDTDDVFVAKDDGFRVEMLPVRIQGKTICIPNTAAIILGTKHRQSAERLIDFLASAETELALAKSKSRQIPVGPVDQNLLPEDVRPLYDWAQDGANLLDLLPARRACLQWLREKR